MDGMRDKAQHTSNNATSTPKAGLCLKLFALVADHAESYLNYTQTHHPHAQSLSQNNLARWTNVKSKQQGKHCKVHARWLRIPRGGSRKWYTTTRATHCRMGNSGCTTFCEL
eukprot:5609782-Amphidinium_carterae.1